LYAELAKVLV